MVSQIEIDITRRRSRGLVSATDSTGVRTYTVSDHLGSLRALVNDTGTVIRSVDYEPFGEVYAENGQATRREFLNLERDRESELGDHGVRTYDAELGRFISVDPLWEKYAGQTNYNYSGNNPVRLLDVTGFDWLLYDGEGVYWYGGDVGDKSELMAAYPGVSGAQEYQNAEYQRMSDRGPVPEGEFSINLRPNPKRIANEVEVAAGTALSPSGSGGIEQIPSYVDESGNRQTEFPAWGYRRAALQPIGETAAPKRHNFYLHDSQKGYSHGCIEVPGALIDRLIQYRADHPRESQIRVRVDYPTPTSPTDGMNAATAMEIGAAVGASP